jgi:hypothetical protein
MSGVGAPRNRLRRDWRRALRTRLGAMHREVLLTVRPDRLLARVGAGTAWQLALIPTDIGGLVEQVVTVRTEAIRWGGRPRREWSRPESLLILDGDWDIVCREPIDSYMDGYPFSRSIYEMFVEGRHFTETTQHAQMVEMLESGKTPKGFTSLTEVHASFEDVVRAYGAIQAEGYRSQADLGTGMPYNEINVYVDRNGELHKQQGEGHHRLAIARLLQVEHVPVYIRGVHKQWVYNCHRRAGGDVISALRHWVLQELAVSTDAEGSRSAGSDQQRAPHS